VTKYGMVFSSIRYWQKQAHWLMLHNDVNVGRALFENDGWLRSASSRAVAQHAIMFAHVSSATQVKVTLRGGLR
jgi:hypothetical protein